MRICVAKRNNLEDKLFKKICCVQVNKTPMEGSTIQ